MIIAKKEGKKLVFTGGFANAFFRDIWKAYQVEAGEYLVFVQVDWQGDWTNEAGFSVYGGS